MKHSTSYIICATQRSGSTLLCEALRSTNLVGYPREYFDALQETGVPQRPLEYFTGSSANDLAEVKEIFRGREFPDEEQRQPPPGVSYEAYLNWAIEQSTTPNGVFGTKLMANYFADFIAKVQTIPRYQQLAGPDLLAALFPNPRYIFVTRRDKVQQAVSLWKALQSWAWSHEDEVARTGETHIPVFHFGAIDHLVQLFEEYDQCWYTFFRHSAIEPLTIVYEELVQSYEEHISEALRYLAIPLPADFAIAPHPMRKQADTRSAEWIERYSALKAEQKKQEYSFVEDV